MPEKNPDGTDWICFGMFKQDSHSWQVIPECQLAEQEEQNSLEHLGQVTEVGTAVLGVAGVVEQMWQIVLQPGFGHQARLASMATSGLTVLDHK